MFDFFRKKRKSQVDPLTAADWIANMVDAVTERARNYYASPQSEPPQLAFFTVIESLLTSGNLLHLAPASVAVLGSVILESRLYYNSVWQSNLLSRFSDQKKIANLHALVEVAETKLWNVFFPNNPGITRLLGQVVEGYSYEKVLDATSIYIQGERPAEQAEFLRKLCASTKEISNLNNDVFENSVLLLFRILTILEERNVYTSEDQFGDIVSQLYSDTERSLSNKLLVEFDLDRCQVAELPPDFYER